MTFKPTLWKNFGAAIDMLGNAVMMCPTDLWEKQEKFYYLSYHTLIFLDYYLARPARDFQPQLPYLLHDPDHLPPGAVDDVLPARFYSQTEMLVALSNIREKCRNLILNADDQRFSQPWIQPEETGLHGLCPSIVENYTLLEIIFYNFRHVQHHVGQLNYLLRAHTNKAPDWVEG
jgi:hypothetical protein